MKRIVLGSEYTGSSVSTSFGRARTSRNRSVRSSSTNRVFWSSSAKWLPSNQFADQDGSAVT
ncbi:hypothetical protein BH18ACT2_BH18ACT2_23170 [soil metagenome]